MGLQQVAVHDRARHRRDVDDRAAAVAQQRAALGLAAQEDAVEVDVHDLLELLQRHVLGRGGVGDPGALTARRSGPSADSTAATASRHRGLVGDVGGDGDRAGAERLDLGDRARGSLRSTQPTSAPASASPSAISRPMPEAAPVTSATVSSRRKEGRGISGLSSREPSGTRRVGDQDVDPAAAQRGADGRELAGAAGDADAARDRVQALGGDAEHAGVELGVQRGPVLVEEAKADVADRAALAQRSTSASQIALPLCASSAEGSRLPMPTSASVSRS